MSQPQSGTSLHKSGLLSLSILPIQAVPLQIESNHELNPGAGLFREALYSSLDDVMLPKPQLRKAQEKFILAFDLHMHIKRKSGLKDKANLTPWKATSLRKGWPQDQMKVQNIAIKNLAIALARC